ncbi:MAG: thioredoxin domain-containing protein [Cytophagales bacterium]|nr:thioredoxin domain-containing protein [Cytophagales bacterium]
MKKEKKPNHLIHSFSPYLKQHAHNPVNWYPWGNEALQLAREADKPIIVSIGYSACHWCHVMERESFENEEIARVMNDAFVCIKVDREERPDVDQIYMEAIQTMGLNGGWPLNVFTMPDQKPFYGGTYFQPGQWLHILKSISLALREKRNQLEASAREFTKAIAITDTEKYGLGDHGFAATADDLKQMVLSMKAYFDRKEGGMKRAPKFPNPTIWNFLLTANAVVDDSEIHDQVMLTLTKISNGGIYDHVGGGFARYSVDDKWFAPHFEKMLYDNGQLISLYSKAYQVKKNDRFKEVVFESVEFVQRELMSPEYGFYSALDADSEGEEGNYYIWSENELERVLGTDAAFLKSYFNTRPEGNWERGLNILHATGSKEEFAKKQNLTFSEFSAKLSRARSGLLKIREGRARPGLDNKILTGWNAIMIKGLTDAYHAFGKSEFLDLAKKNAVFILEKCMADGALLRSYAQGSKPLHGYLDDYALVIDAFWTLYQTTFESRWLTAALDLTEFTLHHFYDPSEELFYYTSDSSEQLIARKKELFDHVIPASNSVMAQNLYFMGAFLEKQSYTDISKTMVSKILPMLKTESRYLANWGALFSYFSHTPVEIAIVGKKYLEFAREIQRFFIPNKVLVASQERNDYPLLKDRKAVNGKTTIYVCFNKSCKLPVHSVREALKQIKNYFPFQA